MILSVGAKGFNYPAWLGTFYPDDIPAEWAIAYYATTFDSVLITRDDRDLNQEMLTSWIEELNHRFSLFIEETNGVKELVQKLVNNLTGNDLPVIAFCTPMDAECNIVERCTIQKMVVKWINGGYENCAVLKISSEHKLDDKALLSLLQYMYKQYRSFKVVFLFFDGMLNNPSSIKAAQTIIELIDPN